MTHFVYSGRADSFGQTILQPEDDMTSAVHTPDAPSIRAPWFLEPAIAKQERALGASMDFLREMVTLSLSASLKLGLILPMTEHRSVLSLDARAVARIVTVRQEDCGPCLQIAVNQSLYEGADLGVVRATLARDDEALPDDLATVYEFTEAVVTDGHVSPNLARRTELTVGGRKGIVDLAFAIAGSRIFSMIKKVMGYSMSCSMVEIETTRT